MHGAAASYGLIWTAPFIGLLLTIAFGPAAAPRLWHRHYGKAALFWAAAILLPEAAAHGGVATAQAALAIALREYLPFILVLGALFTIAGGLRITGTPRATPGVNAAILAIGAALASLIGTTGAAMVMLRPLIRANRHRRDTTHVFVFFIVLVANVGGALTPLGDPPLFLGFLQGVPFFWPAAHLMAPTLALAAALLAAFYAIDRAKHRREDAAPVLAEIEKLGVEGRINLFFLAAVIGAVLLRGVWRPAVGLNLMGVEWELGDIASDAVLLAAGVLSLALTPHTIRRANDFAWGPMAEVAMLFAAIFLAIRPVLAIVKAGAQGPAAPVMTWLFAGGAPVERVFFWATGALSAVLDNAPTYLVFFGFAGGDAANLSGTLAPALKAISMGAVYFGAFTYLGNAPNFMVKAMAESHGVHMPSFFGYTLWALAILLPPMILVELIFLG
jgi:Na+/H+ antiporter NhaD/arsenite permease-like protein